jgi:hypothetical protein
MGGGPATVSTRFVLDVMDSLYDKEVSAKQ